MNGWTNHSLTGMDEMPIGFARDAAYCADCDGETSTENVEI